VSPRIFTRDDVVRAVATRRWIVLAPFAVGIACAPLLARLAPARYRSETLIMVVPQQVPDSYVKATVTQSVADRLPSITDQILSRSRLERIVQEMNLYVSERAREVMEDVVARMRKSVTVDVVGKEADSFRVSYISENAETARKVTERLAALYVEQNLTDRNNQAESTSQFLETQLEDAKRRLVDQEKKLEEYRRQHSGQLPSQLPSNLQAIQSATLQLQALNESTNRAQERRLLIERQIADTQAIPIVAPDSSAEPQVPQNPAQQLEIARGRLKLYEERYTPEHPAMISLKRTIAELEAQVAADASSTESSAPPLTPAEAVQKKKILDLRAELAVVDHLLQTNRAEESRLKVMIASYQGKVDAAPTRESELTELTRDYGTLQSAYSTLLLKRENSTIAANLERRQIGEQFRIIDPASRPNRPSNELQRLSVMSSGAGIGLALGLLIVCFREYHDTSFRREEEIHRTLKLPVLAVVPVMVSRREVDVERRRMLRTDIVGGVLFVTILGLVVLWGVRA
jgi:polysaccharide chain length determinant protein (PEP-CTERM system associated)